MISKGHWLKQPNHVGWNASNRGFGNLDAMHALQFSLRVESQNTAHGSCGPSSVNPATLTCSGEENLLVFLSQGWKMGSHLHQLSFSQRTPVTQPGPLNMTRQPPNVRDSDKPLAPAGRLSGNRRVLAGHDRGLDNRDADRPPPHLNNHALRAASECATNPLHTAAGRTAQPPAPQLSVTPRREASQSGSSKQHGSRDLPCQRHTATYGQFTPAIFLPIPLVLTCADNRIRLRAGILVLGGVLANTVCDVTGVSTLSQPKCCWNQLLRLERLEPAKSIRLC